MSDYKTEVCGYTVNEDGLEAARKQRDLMRRHVRETSVSADRGLSIEMTRAKHVGAINAVDWFLGRYVLLREDPRWIGRVVDGFDAVAVVEVVVRDGRSITSEYRQRVTVPIGALIEVDPTEVEGSGPWLAARNKHEVFRDLRVVAITSHFHDWHGEAWERSDEGQYILAQRAVSDSLARFERDNAAMVAARGNERINLMRAPFNRVADVLAPKPTQAMMEAEGATRILEGRLLMSLCEALSGNAGHGKTTGESWRTYAQQNEVATDREK